MADNANAPFGFRPVKSLAGGEVQINYYKVASSASRIGRGDLVELTSAGYIQRSTSATSVGPWIGVAMADSGTITAEISKFPVCDDPAAIFEVMSASTAALSTTSLNQIYKVSCSTAPDSSTGISKDKVTTTAATASNGVRLLRVIDSPSNVSGAYQRVEVKLNAHYNNPGTAGV